jgi:hypothetical protein
MCSLDAPPNWAQITQEEEPKSRFTDTSVPLFTMYSKMTEEENKEVRRWLKLLNNIVVFVRTSVLLSMSLRT